MQDTLQKVRNEVKAMKTCITIMREQKHLDISGDILEAQKYIEAYANLEVHVENALEVIDRELGENEIARTN